VKANPLAGTAVNSTVLPAGYEDWLGVLRHDAVAVHITDNVYDVATKLGRDGVVG